MPANTQITATLVDNGPVPADQNCLTDVNALLPVLVAYLGIATVNPDSPQSQTDSIAQLALNTANNAIAQVAALQATIPARRTSGSNLVPLTTAGDSTGSVTFAPAMPNVNYQVNFTVHGPAGATNAPIMIVVNDSRTTTGFQFRTLNMPASGTWQFSWEVVAL